VPPRPALSRRALAVLAGIVLAGFALAAAVLGTGGEAGPAPVAGERDGCTQQALRFGYTDDGAVVEQQEAYERELVAGGADLPLPGFTTRALDEVPALHTVTHAYVLVHYRAGLPASELAPLRALAGLAGAQKAPVLVAPRDQREPLVALRDGVRLTCDGVGPPQVRRLRAFAATLYPSLAGDRRGPPAQPLPR